MRMFASISTRYHTLVEQGLKFIHRGTLLGAVCMTPFECAPQVAMTVPLLLPGNGAFPAVGYLHPGGTEDNTKPVSHWVVADFDSLVR